MKTIPELLGLDPLSWAVGILMGIFAGIVLLHSAIKAARHKAEKSGEEKA